MDNTESESKPTPSHTPLREGVDYYIEAGLYVFTAYYLRKRGYCCRSGCRHCPYGYTASSTTSKDDG